MSTWDSMSDADYAACADAGRGEPVDPREIADDARKAVREGGSLTITLDGDGNPIAARPSVQPPLTCPQCGGFMRADVRHVGSAYYVDHVCLSCGYVDVDDEGGV